MKEVPVTKITVGELTLWTRPWANGKALITANDPETNDWLAEMHMGAPDLFEIFVEEDDFCPEDVEGAFSVIVDPENVQMFIELGDGDFGFRILEEEKD